MMETSFDGAEVRNMSCTNDTSCDNFPNDDVSGIDFKFIFEGVLLTAVTVFGLASNTIAVIVLLRPNMRSPFHTLLVYLSVFDIVYLLMSQAIFGFPSISRLYQHSVYPMILPICFGIGHTSRVGSVYLTMSVTIERYFAIVHPLRYVGWKRALAPLSILVAVAYNVPKFFEFRYDFDEGRITQSSLRSNSAYITYYIFWSKFILVEIIPYFTIIVLNSLIMGKIYKSTRFQNRFRYQSTVRGRQKHSGEAREESPSSRQVRENNLAGVLVFISLLFILCQSAKIVPDLYEVIYCRWSAEGRAGGEEDDCTITPFIERVVSFSHFLLAFNSSVNFVIYTWRGTRFRAELLVLFGSRAHSPSTRSTASARRPATFRSTRRCSTTGTTTTYGISAVVDDGGQSFVFNGTPETSL